MNGNTVIQHLVMPSGIADGECPLYNGSSICSQFPLELKSGERLDLRAHFNFLPIGKLKEQTGMKNPSLVLRFTGKISVKVSSFDTTGIISETEYVPTDGEPSPVDCSQGMLLGIAIDAIEDSIIRSGEFQCGCDSVNDVRLAHVICTYHREKKLLDKLSSVERFLDKYPGLKKHYKAYVIDNGHTVTNVNSENIELIYSDNYGGSGGFTRGILEARRDPNTTHILLNDDDASLDPEILFRTAAFYSLLKEEYSDTVLGGTMLPKEDPCVSHESGATFDNYGPHALKHSLNLSGIEANISLESKEKIDYFGWWYLVIPNQCINETGLSLPFFFKIDDVEYGIRLKCNKTTLCGISVWHPSFGNSYSASGVYYANRNTLALLACHGMLDRESINGFFEKALLDTACLRYLSTEATINAVNDFLKGPEHLFNMFRDGPTKQIDYETDSLDVLRPRLKPGVRKEAGFGFRKYTFNGAILPSAGDIETRFDDVRTKNFYRVGKALYVLNGNKGTVCKRSLRKAICQTVKLHFLKKKVLKNMNGLNEEYGKSLKYYSSEKFWKSVFGEE